MYQFVSISVALEFWFEHGLYYNICLDFMTHARPISLHDLDNLNKRGETNNRLQSENSVNLNIKKETEIIYSTIQFNDGDGYFEQVSIKCASSLATIVIVKYMTVSCNIKMLV